MKQEDQSAIHVVRHSCDMIADEYVHVKLKKDHRGNALYTLLCGVI